MNNNRKKFIFIMSILGFIVLLIGAHIGYNYLTSKYDKKNIINETEKGKDDQVNSKNTKIESEDFYEKSNKSKLKATDFVVYDEELNKVKLSDYTGKPVVVNFWASWCPPCKREMPAFNEILKKYSKDQLTFLMINLTDGQRETIDTAKQFIKDNNYNMNILFDKDGSASVNYNVAYIPRTLFIDKNGYVVEDHSGEITKEELESQIKSLLGR